MGATIKKVEKKELFDAIEKMVDSVKNWRNLPEWEKTKDEEDVIDDAVCDIIDMVDDYMGGAISRPWEANVY